MALFQRDPNRANHVVQQDGVEFQQVLARRAQTVLTTLMNLLPSNYISTIQGPNYTNELKAVAVEIARIEMALEAIESDQGFSETRTDFLYSLIGYLVFVNGRLPETGFDDVEFKRFLLSIIKIYFQGSVPQSMADGVALFLAENVSITENFILVRKGASGYDISDQFGFKIDIDCPDGVFPPDVFRTDANIRLVINIIRPAHTLFRIRYIFHDKYVPGGGAGILDKLRWRMASYYYDDFRRYHGGIRDRDRLGVKTSVSVTDEDHSDDF